jgi:hypothetical protein
MFSIAVVSLEINLLMKVEAGEIVSAEAIASNDTRRIAASSTLYLRIHSDNTGVLQVDKQGLKNPERT